MNEKWLDVARFNVSEENDHYIIHATPGIMQYIVVLIHVLLCTLFVLYTFDVTTSPHEFDSLEDKVGMVLYYLVVLFVGIPIIIIPTIGYIVGLFTKKVVILLPETGKIQMRSVWTRKIVSEHAINYIEIPNDTVKWEGNDFDNSYFTLYDRFLNKTLFSIRPGEHVTDDFVGVSELTDFFNSIMRPQWYEVMIQGRNNRKTTHLQTDSCCETNTDLEEFLCDQETNLEEFNVSTTEIGTNK